MKPGYDYHAYNQGNNGENIFKRRDDRIRFLCSIDMRLYARCSQLLHNLIAKESLPSSNSGKSVEDF